MELREGTPEDGVVRQPEHFRYTPTEGGARPWLAWAACKPYWCLTHNVDDFTKPCLKWITHGKIGCVHCTPTHGPRWTGYLGVWRESDLTARLVTLCEENCELSKGVEFGVYVAIHREAGEGNPLVVRKLLSQKAWKSRKWSRQGAVNLTRSLLTIWAMPVLTAWVDDQGGSSDKGVSPDVVVTDQPGERPVDSIDPMYRAAHKRWTPPAPPDEPKPVGEPLKKAMKAIKTAERNGQHKTEE